MRIIFFRNLSDCFPKAITWRSSWRWTSWGRRSNSHWWDPSRIKFRQKAMLQQLNVYLCSYNVFWLFLLLFPGKYLNYYRHTNKILKQKNFVGEHTLCSIKHDCFSYEGWNIKIWEIRLNCKKKLFYINKCSNNYFNFSRH